MRLRTKNSEAPRPSRERRQHGDAAPAVPPSSSRKGGRGDSRIRSALLRRRTTSRRRRRFGPWKLRTLDFYVARLFLSAYVVCGISFLGLFVIVEAFSKLDRFLRQDTNLLVALLQYNAAMVPTVYVNYLGPVITLAAAMFTMTTLVRQNEITPIKAAGVSIYRFCAPIFALSLCLGGLTFYLQESVLPSFKEPIRDAVALARGRPLNNLLCHDHKNNYVIGAAEYSTTKKVAREVYVLERYPDGKPARRIDAHQMVWQPSPSGESGEWLLHDASIQRWDQDGNLLVNTSANTFERLKSLYKRYKLETSVRPIDLETSDIDLTYLSWKELSVQYQRQPHHRHLAVKLHHHFAFPLSHLILLLLGIPFTLNVRNRNLLVSIAASFLICALFHLVSSISMNVANHSEIFSPLLAAWLPVLLFGSLGITLFDHLPT